MFKEFAVQIFMILKHRQHCVPRAPVREVLSRVYLFAHCLNPYNTMHFTRFSHRHNATYQLS